MSSELLLNGTFRTHKARVCSTGFGVTFVALSVLKYWLIDFPLSAVANCFQLRCQSKATDAIVLQKLPLFTSNAIKMITTNKINI